MARRRTREPERDQPSWPPAPTTQAGDTENEKSGLTFDLLPKNVIAGAMAGIAVNFASNFCFMIIGDILWLAIKKKWMPYSPPASSYFGTGTANFLWIVTTLSLLSNLSILFIKRPKKLTVTMAYVLGACLMSCIHIAFWLLVETFNLL